MIMDSDDVYLCHKCGKVFYKLSTLESHSRWKHAEKTNEFMCDQCGRTFQKKYNLIKHLDSAVHEISESVNCALCDFKALNRKLMCEHYQSFHGILLKETNVYFKTADEFFLWKSEFENKTKSRFVKMSSSRRRKNGFIRSTYFCHRDGNFIPKGRNLRHMKVKGSNKINAHCPAKIEVEIGERITIVSYIDTHLGHDQDITRMSLDPADKMLIAKKLALKVPFEQILDEVNSYRKEGDLKRVNLLTRKDLWNIVDTFKINPKNVVFCKNRLRRKKKFEQLKREPRRNQVFVKIFNQESNSADDDEVICNIGEEEEYTGSQVISLKQDNDENVVLCPTKQQHGTLVCLSSADDEDSQYVEEYSVMDDESDEIGGTCLIINANGELQSISGHKIIYTEEGNVEICEALDMDENEIIDDPSFISEGQNSNTGASTLDNKEKDISDIVLTNESMASNSQEFEIKLSDSEMACKEKIVDGVIENVSHEAEDENCVKPNIKEEVVLIKTENNEDIINQMKDEKGLKMDETDEKDDFGQYEVTISNYDGEDENEYVIISTEDEDFVECGIITSENSVEEVLDEPGHLETVLNTVEDGPNCSAASEDVVDDADACEEYIVSSGEGKPKWNVKRKKALHKLLDVHNLINNEQQLQVFSKNISSLENVLKALSKGNNQDSD